jgi:hypothetical protein
MTPGAAPVGLESGDVVVVEHQRTDAIPDPEHPPCRQRRGFCRHHRLHRTPAAEEHALALVDDQQHRPVALLGVDTHLGRRVRAVTFQSMVRTSSPGR